MDPPRTPPRAPPPLDPAVSVQQGVSQRLRRHPDLQLDPAPLRDCASQPGRRLDRQRVRQVREPRGAALAQLVVRRDIHLGGREPLPSPPPSGIEEFPWLQAGLARRVAFCELSVVEAMSDGALQRSTAPGKMRPAATASSPATPQGSRLTMPKSPPPMKA